VNPANVRRHIGRIHGVGDLQLVYRTWEAGSPRAALVLVHGLSDHSRRYEEFGVQSAAAGFSTFACDLRGHGASDGRRGHVSTFDHLIQDLDRFRREVQGLVDGRVPVFILGHSMGGLIVLRYLQEYDAPVQGAVVMSPWLATALPAPRWKLSFAGLASRFVPALPLRARIPPESLTHVQDAVARYRDDPLVHDTITPRLFVEASRAMDLAHLRAERIGVPLLFLLAGDDRIVDTKRAEAFARGIPHGDVAVRTFEGAYHELLQETQRRAVRDEIHAWIGARIRPRDGATVVGG
jgi:lysophospholipase